MKFSQLLQQLQQTLANASLLEDQSLDPEISAIAAIDVAQAGALSFVEGNRFAPWVSKTAASALILPLNPQLQAMATQRQIAWIAVPQPRLLFAQALALFYRPWQPEPGVHASAVVHPSVTLGAGVSVGAHVILHERVQVGAGACLHGNVVVYPDAVIGDRTVVHANCVVHERTQIGADCTIHSGAVLGAEGFGFVPTAEGWHPMPQSGYVVLEDHVSVGCNTTIDRPAVGETRIGQGCKLDNLVQIGHGCQLGPHCVLVGQVGLAGQVQLGERVVLGGQVGVADALHIGAGAIATAQAGITKNVSAGEVVSGYPAMPKQIWLKMMAATRKLPALIDQWRSDES